MRKESKIRAAKIKLLREIIGTSQRDKINKRTTAQKEVGGYSERKHREKGGKVEKIPNEGKE